MKFIFIIMNNMNFFYDYGVCISEERLTQGRLPANGKGIRQNERVPFAWAFEETNSHRHAPRTTQTSLQQEVVA